LRIGDGENTERGGRGGLSYFDLLGVKDDSSDKIAPCEIRCDILGDFISIYFYISSLIGDFRKVVRWEFIWK
jgi:hypothetical protein